MGIRTGLGRHLSPSTTMEVGVECSQGIDTGTGMWSAVRTAMKRLLAFCLGVKRRSALQVHMKAAWIKHTRTG